jgi:hypothetical protein
MRRLTLVAVAAAMSIAACSSDNGASDDSAETTTPASTPSGDASTSSSSTIATIAPPTTGTSVPETTGTPTTNAPVTAESTGGPAPTAPPATPAGNPELPATTVAPAGPADKVVLEMAGFLVPQGAYSFEEAPADLVANWHSLLDATPATSVAPGTLGGVDVYDETGTAIGRAFVFVADTAPAPTTVAELQAAIAPGSTPLPATVAGANGLTWTQGAELMFLGTHADAVVWTISGPGGGEQTLAYLLESLGG